MKRSIPPGTMSKLHTTSTPLARSGVGRRRSHLETESKVTKLKMKSEIYSQSAVPGLPAGRGHIALRKEVQVSNQGPAELCRPDVQHVRLCCRSHVLRHETADLVCRRDLVPEASGLIVLQQ